MSDREKLKKLAEEATPGPWKRGGNHGHQQNDIFTMAEGIGAGEEWEPGDLYPRRIVVTDSGAYPPCKADGEYIAAANPSTILALLSELEQAERERDELAENQRQKNIDKYCKRAKDAEAETVRLRVKAKRATEICENLADVWNDLSISEARRKELNDGYMSQILERDYEDDVDGWVMFERESWLKSYKKLESSEAALRTLRGLAKVRLEICADRMRGCNEYMKNDDGIVQHELIDEIDAWVEEFAAAEGGK